MARTVMSLSQVSWHDSPNAGKAAFLEPCLLGRRHARRFAAYELDSAGGAARVASTGVQNVDARILFDRQHEALPRLDVHGVEPFHGELQHEAMLTEMLAGCGATFQKRHERDWSSRPGSVSSRHLEQVLDELKSVAEHPNRSPTSLTPSGSCVWPRIPGSFAAPRGIHERVLSS